MSFDMQNPMAGSPPTEQATDQAGRLIFRVKPRELTPAGAEFADRLGVFLGVLSLVICALTVSGWDDPDFLHSVAMLMAAALGYMALCCRDMCRVTTQVELRADSIRVKRWLGWQSYDRGIEHRFSLLLHDHAEKERRCHDLAVRKAATEGRAVQKPVYYGDSYHVVLLYAGHRIDLLTVYGMPEAAAVVARLQYCDRLLDQEAKRGNGGGATRATDDWDSAPGGLDDV